MFEIPSPRRVQDRLNTRRGQIYFIALVFLLATAIRYLVFITYFDGRFAMGADSNEYVEWGASIAFGGLPPCQTMLTRQGRTSLYPHFLAAHYRVFGVTQYPVIATQTLLSACIVVITFLIAREAVGRRGAYIAGLLAALYFNELEWAFFILRDHLALFMLLLTFYLLIRWSKDRSPLYLLAGGVVYPLSIICRMDNMVFIPAILLWIAYNLELRKLVSQPRKLVPLLLLGLVLAVFVGWPLTRYALNYMQGAASLGIQWDVWQEQNRIGGFPGMFGKRWGEILAFWFNHPGRFMALALDKFIVTWLLPLHPGYTQFHTVYNLALYPLAFFALAFTTVSWIRGRVNRKVFAFLLLLWLSKTLLIMVTYIDWDFRFRLPVDFVILISLGYLIGAAISYAQQRFIPFLLLQRQRREQATGG